MTLKESPCKALFTVEPRLNEVPSGNLFVVSRVRYIEHLHIRIFGKTTKMFVIYFAKHSISGSENCICNDISVPSYDTSVATVLETHENANKAD